MFRLSNSVPLRDIAPPHRKYLALLCCLSPLLSAVAAAQTSELDQQLQTSIWEADAAGGISPAEDSESKFIVVPIPIVDPTIGQGAALTGLYTFNTEDEATPKERRSTIALAAAYTNTDSWMVGGGFQVYLDEDRYRAGLRLGYGNFNLKYYGTSSDSIFFDNPVGFQTRGSLVDGDLQKRVAEGFYLGVRGRFVNPTVRLDGPIDRLKVKKEFSLAALGVIGQYDSRDNTWYPEAGLLGSIDLLAYLEAIGSDNEFGSLEFTFAQYAKLTDGLVLAGQLRSAIVGDNAPFFMLSTIKLRGFPYGRYLNQMATEVQGELRWEAWRRLGAVVFAGVGVAAEDYSDLGGGGGDNAYGYGVGLRYRVSEIDRINVGLDVAYGSSDEIAVYFRIGEAF
jgi:outer membrane protein assembly factor BamA